MVAVMAFGWFTMRGISTFIYSTFGISSVTIHTLIFLTTRRWINWAFSFPSGYFIFTITDYLNEFSPHDAIILYRNTIARMSPGDERSTIYLANLGTVLFLRFKSALGTLHDLDEAIASYRGAIANSSGDGQSIRHLERLAGLLWERFQLTQGREDMEEAVKHFQTVFNARPPGHPYRITAVFNLIQTVIVRNTELGRPEDDAVVWRLYGELLASCQPSFTSRILFHCREILQLKLVSEVFTYLHYSPVLVMPSPSELLTALTATIDQLTLDLMSTMLTQLAEDPTDQKLKSSISILGNVLDSNPQPQRQRHIYSGALGHVYSISFGQLGELSDLENAIAHYRDGLYQCPKDHAVRQFHLTNLATALRSRYTQLGQTDDLTEAIVCYLEAHSLSPPGHPERPLTTMNLANTLILRYQSDGDLGDLQQAVVQLREMLLWMPDDHPLRASIITSIAVNLGIRSDITGNDGDLEDAVTYLRSALMLSTSGSVRQSTLHNMSTALMTRFSHLNSIADLEEAIIHLREALSLCPMRSPDRWALLLNLISSIMTRFEMLNLAPDIDEVIQLCGQALDACPPGHINRTACLDNLGSALHSRYLYNEGTQLSDLEESIAHRESVVLHYRQGHSLLSGALESLAIVIHERFIKLRDVEDLERVIELHHEALSFCPPGHTRRFQVLFNLGNAMRERYALHKHASDLEDAISHYSEAETLHPADRTAQIGVKKALAVSYLDRAQIAASVDGVEEAFMLFELAANHHNATSRDQFGAALVWVQKARQHKHRSLLRAYSRALTLLDRSLLMYPTIEAQQKLLATFPKSLAVDTAATAISEGKLELAIECLEQGRAVLWSRMTGYRHSLEKLRAVDEALATRFETLSAQLEQHATTLEHKSFHPFSVSGHPEGISVGLPPNIEHRLQTQRLVFKRWEQTVDRIRDTEGFGDFLRTVRFSTLRKAAVEGPVIVINISKHRSDAIIVRHVDPLVLVPLPNATPEVISELASRLREAINQNNATMSYPARMTTLIRVLRALWEHVVSPLKEKLDELGIQEGSRIWWCPTAELCSLPIHAAGRHRPGEKNLPDLYISSYVPTLASLIRSREGTVTASKPELAIIALLDDSLPMVQEEIDRIEQSVPWATLLAGNKANHEEVLSALRTHSWAHFACHGALRSQPFQSLFELQNGETLTLLDIIKARLPRAEFAFLSACHTAAAQDAGTPDEVIHLASALQFSGFRSVVGTLWEIVDDDAPDVAGEFYRNLAEFEGRDEAEGRAMDYGNSARAMNSSVNRLRSQQGMTPDRWVPFVHVGV